MYPTCKQKASLSNTLRIIQNHLAGLQTEILAINSKCRANKCDGKIKAFHNYALHRKRRQGTILEYNFSTLQEKKRF